MADLHDWLAAKRDTDDLLEHARNLIKRASTKPSAKDNEAIATLVSASIFAAAIREAATRMDYVLRDLWATDR